MLSPQGNHTRPEFDYLSEVSDSEVISIKNGLENKKASVVDGIPVRFIKAEPTSIGQLITRLINRSITSGIFPDLWKHAVVTLIQKTKFSTELKNFRPVSALPVLSKVLERVVYNQLISYLLRNSVLSDCQSGFRPNYSTQDVRTSTHYRFLEEGY